MSRFRGPNLDPPDDPQEVMWEEIGEFVYEYAEKNHLRYWGCSAEQIKDTFDDLMVDAGTPMTAVLDAIVTWAMKDGSDSALENAALVAAEEASAKAERGPYDVKVCYCTNNDHKRHLKGVLVMNGITMRSTAKNERCGIELPYPVASSQFAVCEGCHGDA